METFKLITLFIYVFGYIIGILGCVLAFSVMIIEWIFNREFDTPYLIANILYGGGMGLLLVSLIFSLIGKIFIW
jgi:hypothetical protein